MKSGMTILFLAMTLFIAAILSNCEAGFRIDSVK